EARAGNRHAQPENEGGDDKGQADRTDMGGRWQAPRGRGGQPGAENDGVADGADGKRHQDGQNPRRLAPFNEVAKIAVKAEAAALQYRAECSADRQRKRQRPPLRTLSVQRGESPEQANGDDEGQAEAKGGMGHVMPYEKTGAGVAPVPIQR